MKTATIPDRYTLGGLDPEINALSFNTIRVTDLNADAKLGLTTPVSGDTLAHFRKPHNAVPRETRRARILEELQ